MTKSRPLHRLNTTIRCFTCHTPLSPNSDQAETLRLTLRTAAACAVCGMSGEYSLVGGTAEKRTPAAAPPVSPPPFASQRAPQFGPTRPMSVVPHFASVVPHFAPAAPKQESKPPVTGSVFSPVNPPAAGPRPTLIERWKGLSKGRQWAVTIALVVVVAAADGSRRVVAIDEAGGLDAKERYRLWLIFRFRQTGRDGAGNILGALEPTGRRSRFGREVLALADPVDVELTRPIWQPKARA